MPNTMPNTLEVELALRYQELRNESDEAKERRLELEARQRFLGELKESPTARGDGARVEVTLGRDGLEGAGYYLVRLVEMPAELLEEMSEGEQQLERARELVLEELERAFPHADYRSVDDVTSW